MGLRTGDNLNVKLFDFGYATYETTFDENNHKGTPKYLSPEMLMKKVLIYLNPIFGQLE